MQIKSDFFVIYPNYSAHLPNKMQFFVKKECKHLLKQKIFRNFVVEFIASAMAAPRGVRGIEPCCGGNQPL